MTGRKGALGAKSAVAAFFICAWGMQVFGAELAEGRSIDPANVSSLAASSSGEGASAAGPLPERWNAHLQSTWVWQRKPSFTSPYEGPNSLIGARERSYSLTATAALGLRLARNTEFYYNPEMALGEPFSNLLGLAGFSNGELAKTSGPNPTFYNARLFLRHTIGFGGGSESLDSDANQLAGTADKRRLVLTAGRISLLDIFDANAYAHDPRTQFLNWALMTHAAYDYAADSRGYAEGLAVEWIDDGYAVRAGRFTQPREPNGLKLDNDLARHYGDQIELSKDYAFGSQRGTARLLVFRSRAVMARYADALALADASTPPAAPTLASARTGVQTKWGIGLAVEHQLRPDIGLFARAMHADGRTETYAFTEADRSFSVGMLMQGTRWGRPQDSLGLAMAVSSILADHRRFLAQGGTTFFLGDGQLRYGAERVFEAFYSVALHKTLSLSFDVQRIQNPGYNRDRGPVSFFGVRAHWEY